MELADRLTSSEIGGYQVVLRKATEADLPEVVRLLAADVLGSTREDPDGDLRPYRVAYRMIEDSPMDLLVVAIVDGQIVGTLQLTLLPGLARQGALRAQIEAVRVRDDFRDRGVGRFIFDWAIAESRRRGCSLVQLTTDKARPRAHDFYRSLGFVASHEGMKLTL